MEKRLDKIKKLKSQLLELGYHSFQLDNIIKDAVGAGNKDLDTARANCLIETLEEYLHFALKCKGSNKKIQSA